MNLFCSSSLIKNSLTSIYVFPNELSLSDRQLISRGQRIMARKHSEGSKKTGDNRLTTPQKNLFALSCFQIPHKPVLVLPKIFRGPLDLAMASGFLHLANYKAQNVFCHRLFGFLLVK